MPDMPSDPESIERLLAQAEAAEARAASSFARAREARARASAAYALADEDVREAGHVCDAARATVHALRKALSLPPKT